MAVVQAWQGPSDDATVAMAEMEITGSYEGREETFSLPSRLDYTNAFREAGLLGPGEDLAGQPTLAAAAQAHWHAAGPNACVFAGYLSGQRATYGWETYVITEADTARDIAAEIVGVSKPRLVAPEVEVVSLLLPELTDEAALAALLARLSGRADWDVWDEGKEEDDELGTIVRLGVRAAVEFDHWSEVLGFGCFPAQPNTRCAPVTELAVRAKAPERPRRNHRAYMADVQIDMDRVEYGEWWHNTKQERAKRLLPKQDLRGKARVTFSLREETWRGTAG